MTLLLALFAAGVVLELLPYLGGLLWRGRKVCAALALVATAFAGGFLLVAHPGVWAVLIGVVSLYRVGNNVRVLQGRMHEHYLRAATIRTSLVLIGVQIVLSGAAHIRIDGSVAWLAVALLQVAVAVALYISTQRRLRRTAWPHQASGIADSELPTLTVAIPARNETDDLQACLESLVACNYAKLEILVLDDCSQTKRTPEIIRGFAHDGVRFLEGEPPQETWLAKNQAYEHLAREASGQYILFCGVDVRFGSDSLRQVVAMLQHRHKKMLSLLPRRTNTVQRTLALAQSMRYAWELVPPRRLFRRPPVLSTCWVIEKTALDAAGGFAAAKRSIVPEAHFARTLVKTDAYSFMRANPTLGIESTKPAKEQGETAVRMRYPQLHKRPENVLLLTLLYGVLFLLPFCMVVLGFFVTIGLAAHILAAAAVLLLAVTYGKVVAATRTGNSLLSLVEVPIAVVYDIALLHTSMWQYEFSVVEWKGRNVCIPAMHVIPHLPKI